MSNPTGYGPSTRQNHIYFDGNEKNYEIFEMKFMGHLHRLKLKNELKKETIDREKNEDIFAELIQVIDDRSLALIMRDALDGGKKHCRYSESTICPRVNQKSCVCTQN